MGSDHTALLPPAQFPIFLGESVSLWIKVNMLHLLLLLSASVFAQDTYTCPDGWHVSDIGDEVECILLSGKDERVTKADAAVICEFHEGWLVDMDEGRGPQKNNLLKSLISEADPGSPGFPGNQYGDQWWIGAKWFDWMKNEPNDWHGQNCLTFPKDQDIFGF